MEPVDHPRVKICGITRLEDAEHAVEAGAWALGMIFWPGSKRLCDPGEAQRIGARLRRRVELAGVFVNPALDEVAALAEVVPLSLVQLHGDEGPVFCSEVARRTGARVIKAAAVHAGSDVQALEAFHTDFHLLDTHRPGLRGGTGESFDWELARLRRSGAPLILSGGLHAGNVADAIAATSPYAVDTASGTEAAEPGVKDHAKVEAFIAAVAATAEVPAG